MSEETVTQHAMRELKGALQRIIQGDVEGDDVPSTIEAMLLNLETVRPLRPRS